MLRLAGRFYREFAELPQLHPADFDEVAFHVHALAHRRDAGGDTAPIRIPRP
ncbi:MAG: hypothetical protein H0T13_05070 [Actinobacteria bacterium]|nr:hypothetical protein [Actinomycetota bacterium]